VRFSGTAALLQLHLHTAAAILRLCSLAPSRNALAMSIYLATVLRSSKTARFMVAAWHIGNMGQHVEQVALLCIDDLLHLR